MKARLKKVNERGMMANVVGSAGKKKEIVMVVSKEQEVRPVRYRR